MIRYMRLKLAVATTLLLLTTPSFAKWYNVSGTAPIIDSTAQARDAAVNDAIRNAMLEAGAQVSIEQNFKDGVLTGNSMSVKSSIPVRKVMITSEQKTAGRVSVTAKVLLADVHIETCAASKIKKSVLPVAFSYSDQAAYQGSQGIDTINRELSSELFSKLSASPVLLMRPEIKANLRGSSSGNSTDTYLRDNLSSLTRQHEAQYLITGTVDSVAASDAGEGVLDKLFYQRTRSLSFTVTMYDGAVGEQLFSKQYSMECDWPFKQGEFMDLRSERFRGSSYGQRMQQLISDAVTDVVQLMQCRMPEATIIDLDDEGFIIDIGRSNAITRGMKFSMVQLSQGFAPDGDTYDRRDDARGLYVVQQVYENSARLIPEDLDNNLLNIRVNDRVILKQ